MQLPTINMDENHLIKGDLIKCVDGRWTTRDGGSVPDTLLVLGRIRAIQRWQDKKVVGLIVQKGDEPLPAAAELNAKIPQAEWEDGLDGEPRPPWQAIWGFYLADPKDASTYTFVNGTVGSRIAFDRLNDRIDTMRAFRGEGVAPVVKLDNRPMKTNFGTKLRPEFSILQWVGTGSDGKPIPRIENKPLPSAPAVNLKTVPAVSASEELDDSIPF